MREAIGYDVPLEDVAWLAPLEWRHVNMLRRDDFSTSPGVADRDLRPLRDPNTELGLEE